MIKEEIQMLKKLLGTLGAAASVGATLYHAIDPTQLPAKYAAVLAIIGTVAALFGKHPAAPPDSTTK